MGEVTAGGSWQEQDAEPDQPCNPQIGATETFASRDKELERDVDGVAGYDEEEDGQAASSPAFGTGELGMHLIKRSGWHCGTDCVT